MMPFFRVHFPQSQRVVSLNTKINLQDITVTFQKQIFSALFVIFYNSYHHVIILIFLDISILDS